ncbi:MAG TPA: tRNA (guanosine(37)-N1)-methyltransferase TrmD [Limnochordia bacterium]
MRIDILTLFPDMVAGPLRESILGRAIESGRITVQVHDIRLFARDRHRTVDDTPYGGGAGMVLKPEPVVAAVEWVMASGPAAERPSVILLSPQGRLLEQALVRELAQRAWLVLICGHYEGVDERVRQLVVTDEISIGDYVLTGGELPALVLTDAVARLIPGVLGGDASCAEESFTDGLLEYPHYTRPAEFRGLRVPPVLLSGHHAEIRRWRRRESLRRTKARRPELLARATLTAEDQQLLAELAAEPAEAPTAPRIPSEQSLGCDHRGETSR